MAWASLRFREPRHSAGLAAGSLLAALLAGVPAPAPAESPSIAQPTVPQTIIVSPNRLSSSIVRQEMAKLGYRKFGKLRLKSGVIYEMEASDAKGRRYKLIIDPDTARLLRRMRLS